MATAGEMIRTIADAISRPEATVTSYYGKLRKDHLISTTGRGRSAQDLSPLDVARIIIVMLSADSLEEGAAVAKLVGDLRHDRYDEDYNPIADIRFEDALANILEFRAARQKGLPTVDDGLLGDMSADEVLVRVTATHLSAELVLGGQVTPFHNLSAEPPPMAYPDDWGQISIEDRLVLRAMMEGMSVTRAIDGSVIDRVARKLG